MFILRLNLLLLSALAMTMSVAGGALALSGEVLWHQKISTTEGGFLGAPEQTFGHSVVSLGDLDGDTVGDLAVGARWNGLAGAVWVLLLNTDGTVKAHQEISDTQGGFTGVLDAADCFGSAVAAIGDLDGDGVTDLAVGAERDDDYGPDRGAVWMLFLNADGTVKSHQKISATQGGFPDTLDAYDYLGGALAALGDHDGDGVEDVAVGAVGDDDGSESRGAVWILFLNTDGTVKSHQKISATSGGFTGQLDDSDWFGTSLTSLGDVDGDEVGDVAVGASLDGDGGTQVGAVWVLFLNNDGTVKSHQKISTVEGGFTGLLQDGDYFGSALAAIGDQDGDGAGDLAVGAAGDDDGGSNRGAAWVLFMNNDGTVAAHQKISDLEGGFTGTLDNGDTFGRGVASLGDLDGDGNGDIAVGAPWDDDGGSGRGAVWMLFLDGGTVSVGAETAQPLLPRLTSAPNPVDGRTTLRYSLPAAAAVRIGVYDASGRLVVTLAEGVQEPGSHSLIWDGADGRGGSVVAGVYFARLVTNGVLYNQKIVVTSSSSTSRH